MTKESRDDMIHRWSMTNDLQEFVKLGKELHPEATEEFFTQMFKDSYKTGSPSQDEPEREFTELLLEASTTEDLTEKEAIFAKIEELEIKKEREALKKGGE